MTKLLRPLVGITLFAFAGVGDVHSESSEMVGINALVKTLVGRGAHQVDNALEQHDLETSGDFLQLQNLCRANWKLILDNFTGVSNADDGKAVVIAAFEALDPSDYMSALDRLGEYFVQDQLSKGLMRTAFIPKGRMRAFLPYNYQHPRVRAFLTRISPHLPNTDPIKEEISQILSGQTKNGLDKFRAENEGIPDGNIPGIILPAN